MHIIQENISHLLVLDPVSVMMSTILAFFFFYICEVVELIKSQGDILVANYLLVEGISSYSITKCMIILVHDSNKT